MKLQPDIQRLLDAAFEYTLAEYGQRGYQFWEKLIGDQINFAHPEEPSTQVEIMPLFDDRKHSKRIRVIVFLPHTSLLRAFTSSEPAKSFFINPDGSIEP
jgi:hypothetical protein